MGNPLAAQAPTSPVLPLLKRLKVLHLKKSRMYCGTHSDPLHNYKVAARAVGIEPWRYALGRVFEKQERIKSILKLDEKEMKAALLAELPDTALMDLITVALIQDDSKEKI
jgi:hypothetical protein